MTNRAHDYNRQLGRRVSLERTGRGITREQLAKMAGLTPCRVKRIEEGLGCTVVKLVAVCDALGVRPSSLLHKVDRESAGGAS